MIGIIRAPMVYGEGCKGNYTKLVRLVKYTPIFPAIHNKRSMININTLCDYVVKMIINEESGIFLPQDENYTDISLFVKEIRNSMGKKTILIPGVAWVIRLMMRRIGVLRKMFGDWYFERD